MSHKQVEQHRRLKAKQYFDELRCLIPNGTDPKCDRNRLYNYPHLTARWNNQAAFLNFDESFYQGSSDYYRAYQEHKGGKNGRPSVHAGAGEPFQNLRGHVISKSGAHPSYGRVNMKSQTRTPRTDAAEIMP